MYVLSMSLFLGALFLFPRLTHHSKWLLYFQQSSDIPANTKEVTKEEIIPFLKEIGKSERIGILGEMMISFT